VAQQFYFQEFILQKYMYRDVHFGGIHKLIGKTGNQSKNPLVED
jgi:hypothetical protein